MAMVVELEIFVDNEWVLMGQVEVDATAISRGIKAPGTFSYELNYLDRFGEHLLSHGIYAASVRYPLNFARYVEKEWPAFLLDLIPTGAARANWIKRLEIGDGPEADFVLLSKGLLTRLDISEWQVVSDYSQPIMVIPGSLVKR
ncbi:MAG: hypothetical protein HC883_05390 [Bdellovibrionaceae bacterium]|nr:hypothetical protein [Pseudobdellovibrionaceae bacterium]